jgi:hypothetical protein
MTPRESVLAAYPNAAKENVLVRRGGGWFVYADLQRGVRRLGRGSSELEAWQTAVMAVTAERDAHGVLVHQWLIDHGMFPVP